MQESDLSRRKLTFGFNRLDMECQHSNVNFDYTKKTVRIGITHHNGGPPKLDYFEQEQSLPVDGLHGAWILLVVKYTSRRLTMAKDKLPAISGLAQKFHQRARKDKYLAGLWLDHINIGLLWFIDRKHDFPEMIEIGEIVPTRAAINRAPSWSWASIDGRVNFGPPIGLYRFESDLRAIHIVPKLSRGTIWRASSGWLSGSGCLCQAGSSVTRK